MLSGSADKTIKLWKAGHCEKTYTGTLVHLIHLMLLTVINNVYVILNIAKVELV